MPKKMVDKGFGSICWRRISEMDWKNDVEHLLYEGHNQCVWIREAGALYHLSHVGSTSGYARDDLVFELWTRCMALNFKSEWRAHVEEKSRHQVENYIPSVKAELRSCALSWSYRRQWGNRWFLKLNPKDETPFDWRPAERNTAGLWGCEDELIIDV